MKKLVIKLENCHGIKKLEHTFDFSGHSVCAIYAANGSMKSSLAKTLQDIIGGVESTDRIYPALPCLRSVIDENGVPLTEKDLLVLIPYDEALGHTEKTSTLLVNDKLRKEYGMLQDELDKVKDALISALKKQSGSSRDLEKEVSRTFRKTDDAFYPALSFIKEEVRDNKDPVFANVKYDVIFDEKVLAFLKEPDAQEAIQEYIARYNDLIAASTYFKRGVFEYYNASEIAKTLADHGFFTAKHTVVLNAVEKREISTRKELEDLIAQELEHIANDASLRKTFDKLKKKLEKNVTLRSFHQYLVANPLLVPHLSNIELFRDQVWVSYLKSQRESFEAVLAKRGEIGPKIEAIEEAAGNERTLWQEVIDLFNSRFSVPFELEAKNRIAVMLGHEPILSLDFKFDDGRGAAAVQRDTLLKVLSQGEKKALYILNILFEVEVRRKTNQETLFVLDDIADSFDYKNKYAIIQYLKEIAETSNFRQVILTHNFDFFRTLQSRGVVRYDKCLMVFKNNVGIRLEKAEGIQNVFVKDWKPKFFSDGKKKIASISFMRNLIEFTRGDGDPQYAKLTSLLHWKPDTSGITESELDQIYNSLFSGAGGSKNPQKPVIDLIDEEARACLTASDGINFEHKIVLSIATRLAAERFMVDKIGDAVLWAGIEEHQTPRLLAEFAQRFGGDSATIRTLQKVVLMTPENIHLNSFMYEPILDMSDEHLRILYKAVQDLH